MSQHPPARPASAPAHRRRRLLWGLLGSVTLLGVAWSASATTGLLEQQPAAPAEPAALAGLPEPAAQDVGAAVGRWLGLAGELDDPALVEETAAFGSKEYAAERLPHLAEFLSWADLRITDLLAPGISVADLDAALDDLDANGDPASDFADVPGLTVDLDADVTGTGPYQVSASLTARFAGTAPLTATLDGMALRDPAAEHSATISLANVIHVDPAGQRPITIPVPATPSGSLTSEVARTFEAAQPGALTIGVLGARAAGPVEASTSVAATLRDPNADGVLDGTELATPAGLVTTACAASGASVDLAVTTDLTGLTGRTGRITLADTNLCNGMAVADAQLGDLGLFRNVTQGDVLNGLAQLTRALGSVQTAGDVSVPFVQEPLRDLVRIEERLVKFFLDNELTDPADPLAMIILPSEDAPRLTTIQDIAAKWAEALGMDAAELGLKFAGGRVSLHVATEVEKEPVAATLDFGETFKRVGVTQVRRTGTATVTPSYELDLGIGIDLAAGKPFDERFALFNGGQGPTVATLDVPTKADVDMDASASTVELRLLDSSEAGGVTTLARKDATKPMLTFGLVDPDNVWGTTLAEFAAAGALPASATVNAAVPPTRLTSEANVIGAIMDSGTVTVTWPDVSVADGLTVAASQDFIDGPLQLAIDLENPRKLITEILKGTKETLGSMRAAVATRDSATTRPLPLVGKSVAELDPLLADIEHVVDTLIQTNELLTIPALRAKLIEVVTDALGISDVAGLTSAESRAVTKAAGDMVTFRYQKKTSTTPATVLLDLNLGVCTDTRSDGREACSFEVDQPTIPFNLDLGSDSKAGGIAGVGTEGELRLDFDARIDATIGVELPNVTPNQSFPWIPRVSGSLRHFVLDDAVIDLGFGAHLNGQLTAALGALQVELGTADDLAVASVAARLTLKSNAPENRRITLFSTAFKEWLGTLLPTAESGQLTEPDGALKARCPDVTVPVDACASLPVYVEGTSLGEVTFTAADLLEPSGWDIDSSAVEEKVGNEAVQWALLVDGVRTLIQQASTGLKSLPEGTKIPLIGADVAAGADVLDTLDKAVLERVDLMTTAIANVGTTRELDETAEEVLAGIEGLPTTDRPEVTLTCRSLDGTTVAPCVGDELVSRLQSFEARLPLFFGTSGKAAPFDFGFPGLRLATEGTLQASAGLEVNLAFGVDRDFGFYVPTAGSEPEFALVAKANLPNVGGGRPDLTGDLAFIPITIEDNQNAPNVDDVSVTAGLDLTTGRADGRLGLAELGRVELTPTLDATSTIRLGLKTSLGGAPSGLPSFTTDLAVDARVRWVPGSDPTTTARIEFQNVAIDVGTLVGDFIQPVVKTIRTYTSPLEKPIEAIQKPIPGVAEAARLVGKKAPTWYDAFKAADRAANGPDSTGMQVIDRVIQFVELVKALDASNKPSGQIPIGSFTVYSDVAQEPMPLEDADKLIASRTVTTGNIIRRLDFEAADELEESVDEGGFSFPAFEQPSTLFGMLIGKDVTLVHFDAGRLGVERGFQFSYPLGPARLYIGGSAGVSGHLAAGFDTYGMRKAYQMLNDDDPSNDGAWSVTKGLLQSLYLDDFDKQGNDVPEIRFDAELTAGASIGIPGIEAGAEGGVHGTAEFNLKADSTGKLRYTQIAAQLKVQPNPLCFFDASASIDAFIRAYVDTPFGGAEWPIVSARIYEQKDLFSFCRTPADQRENLLADLSEDGTLTFRTDTAPQDLVVTQLDADTVEVQGLGVVETYEPVKKMVADLKSGDDVMTVEFNGTDPATARLPVTICGGAGNDRVSVTSGAVALYGDAGPGCTAVPAALAGSDFLVSGGFPDTVEGGPGGDALQTGGGDDAVTGGPGDDVLRAGLGNDTIDGGEGNDTTDYSDHVAPVTATLPGPSGSAGEADMALGVESIYGSPHDDLITLPEAGSTVADGGAGNDRIVAATGTGLLMGSDGNDTFVGGAGPAQLIGSGGDDTFVDGPGAQTFLGLEGEDTADYGEVDGPVRVVLDGQVGDGPIGKRTQIDNVIDTDVVIGTWHDDQLIGGAGDEELRGGNGTDLLEGGPGSDVLRGGEGEDDLLGDSGHDVLDGGAGGDHLRGGSGGDDLGGGDGHDWADYTDRTEALVITKDDAADDGSPVDLRGDNVRTDVERISTGSGNDTVTGWNGGDLLEGNRGTDVLNGNEGVDVLDGSEGNDQLYDLEFNRRFETRGDGTGGDTYLAGPGDDWAYGNGGGDLFEMGDGSDRAYAGEDADTMHGGWGDDELRGGAGNDVIDGEGNDDSLWGDDGDDEVSQGASDDTVGAHVRGGNGADTLYNGDNGGNVTTGVGGTTEETDTSPNTVHGYAGVDNRYNGSLGPDTFLLGNGNDLVHANTGDDVVRAGEGNNIVHAEAGNDTVVTLSGKDGVFGGQGNDTLAAGSGDDQVTGDPGNDTISAGDGDDKAYGGTGDDRIDGGANADEMHGDDGTDTVTYETRTTPVTIREDGNWTEGGVEDLTVRTGDTRTRDYLGPTNEVVVGGAGDDAITLRNHFRTAPVRIEGRAGNDTLTIQRAVIDATLVGGAGDDTMTGGDGDDVFDQGTAPDGADDLRGGGGADVADYGRRPAGSVTVTFDDTANDGAAGERDNVRADVETAATEDPCGGEPCDPCEVKPCEEPPYTVSMAPVRVGEGTGGDGTATVTVTLGAPRTTQLQLPWSATPGSASAADFSAASGTVTFAPGVTTATFAVGVVGDALDEDDETVALRVGAAPGATASTTLTIVDDDAPPQVVVGSRTAREPKRGAQSVPFTVTLTAPSAKSVTVTVGTANGTAKAGKDFTAQPTTLTFAPGQTSATYVVKVKKDSAKERVERFRVVLSSASNASAGPAATVTIRNRP